MSLLMQALRKAERAHTHGADENGLPADNGQADSWQLEPLGATAPSGSEVPVVPAQEAVHDPVPPQARHAAQPAEASRASNDDGMAGGMRAPRPPPGKRMDDAAAARIRLGILGGIVLTILFAFALIYWRALSGPGPGARLPMVPMPPAGTPLAATGLTLPPTPSGETAGAAQIDGMPPEAAGGAALLPGAAAAPTQPTAGYDSIVAAPSRPSGAVTMPTPEQLAAISDPAIRAEALRDAAERQARQATVDSTAPATPAPISTAVAAAPVNDNATSAPPGAAHAPAAAYEAPAVPHRLAADPAPASAIGAQGDVHFVRGNHISQVAPAVQSGYAALQAGDLATARTQYDQALLQDPNNRDALLGSAVLAVRAHDGNQAVANYAHLLELDPNDPDALAGLTSLRPGDLPASEIRLKGMLRQHPESGTLHFALGNLYARQGRWPEAQQSYFRAFGATPGNPDYAFNLGVGLDRMNQPHLAETYYRRALELAQAAPAAFDATAVRKRLQELTPPPR